MDYFFIRDEEKKEFCCEECNTSDSYPESRYHTVIVSLNSKRLRSLIGNVQPVSDYKEYKEDFAKNGYKYNAMLFVELLSEYNSTREEDEPYIM